MSPSSRPVAHRLPAWLGPCASFVCLVHCFGTGLLALFAPGLLRLLPHTEIFEWAVLAIAALSGASVLRRQNATKAWQALYAVSLVSAALGLIFEAHTISHLAIFVLGTSPAVLLILKHRERRNVPACCEGHCQTSAGSDPL